jgi:hypothetical protein
MNRYSKIIELYMSRMGQHFINRMQAQRSLRLHKPSLLFARVAVHPLKNRWYSARYCLCGFCFTGRCPVLRYVRALPFRALEHLYLRAKHLKTLVTCNS